MLIVVQYPVLWEGGIFTTHMYMREWGGGRKGVGRGEEGSGEGGGGRKGVGKGEEGSCVVFLVVWLSIANCLPYESV